MIVLSRCLNLVFILWWSPCIIICLYFSQQWTVWTLLKNLMSEIRINFIKDLVHLKLWDKSSGLIRRLRCCFFTGRRSGSTASSRTAERRQTSTRTGRSWSITWCRSAPAPPCVPDATLPSMRSNSSCVSCYCTSTCSWRTARPKPPRTLAEPDWASCSPPPTCASATDCVPSNSDAPLIKCLHVNIPSQYFQDVWHKNVKDVPRPLL